MTVLKDYYEVLGKLSTDELNKLEVIKWLISNSNSVRGTGRTKLMAIAFVRLSLEGERIELFDHSQKIASVEISNMIHNVFKSSDITISHGVIDNKNAVFAEGAMILPNAHEEELVESLLLDLQALCGLLMRGRVSSEVLHNIINTLEVESVMKL
jgi:hypothetical protein